LKDLEKRLINSTTCYVQSLKEVKRNSARTSFLGLLGQIFVENLNFVKDEILKLFFRKGQAFTNNKRETVQSSDDLLRSGTLESKQKHLNAN
jgi:hypothetical protein